MSFIHSHIFILYTGQGCSRFNTLGESVEEFTTNRMLGNYIFFLIGNGWCVEKAFQAGDVKWIAQINAKTIRFEKYFNDYISK